MVPLAIQSEPALASAMRRTALNESGEGRDADVYEESAGSVDGGSLEAAGSLGFERLLGLAQSMRRYRLSFAADLSPERMFEPSQKSGGRHRLDDLKRDFARTEQQAGDALRVRKAEHYSQEHQPVGGMGQSSVDATIGHDEFSRQNQSHQGREVAYLSGRDRFLTTAAQPGLSEHDSTVHAAVRPIHGSDVDVVSSTSFKEGGTTLSPDSMLAVQESRATPFFNGRVASWSVTLGEQVARVLGGDGGRSGDAGADSSIHQQVRGASQESSQSDQTKGASGSKSEANYASQAKGMESSRQADFDDLVRTIRLQVGSKYSTARMRLHPPELGRVLVNVRMEEEGLKIEVKTETRQAEQMLAHRAEWLRAALLQHGIHVDQFDVSDGLGKQTSEDSGFAQHGGRAFMDVGEGEEGYDGFTGTLGEDESGEGYEYLMPYIGTDSEHLGGEVWLDIKA